MAAPHDRNAEGPKAVDHAGGLGVVEQNDVAGADHVDHRGDVGIDDPLVAGSFACAEGTAIAGVTMQQVVHALGDREELRFAVEDQPPVLDLRPPAVGQQCLEHLGDAAPVGGGVDVPDRAAPEFRPGPRPALGQASGPFGRQDAGQ